MKINLYDFFYKSAYFQDFTPLWIKNLSCTICTATFMNLMYFQNSQKYINPIPNRLGHVKYNERADSTLTW